MHCQQPGMCVCIGHSCVVASGQGPSVPAQPVVVCPSLLQWLVCGCHVVRLYAAGLPQACGNGDIDPGEACDGDLYCTPACEWQCDIGPGAGCLLAPNGSPQCLFQPPPLSGASQCLSCAGSLCGVCLIPWFGGPASVVFDAAILPNSTCSLAMQTMY